MRFAAFCRNGRALFATLIFRMKTLTLLVLGALLATAPTPLANANPPRGRSTSPICPLQCPQGFQVQVYTWEVHPERTIYDDLGKAQIAPDSPWPVSCTLRCEQHVDNQPAKEWKDTKVLCSSGGEPSPYRGPWRNSGPWGKQCAATAKNGCGMQCYPVRVAKPAGKGGRKAGASK